MYIFFVLLSFLGVEWLECETEMVHTCHPKLLEDKNVYLF